MRANIISTGEELISGSISDTNASFIASHLKNIGIQTKEINVIGDDLNCLSILLKESSQNYDLVIVTGGLGPTSDDITSLGAANATQDSLVLNEKAYGFMKSYFKERKFELTKENEKQAFLPSKAIPIINSHGTAPGFLLEYNKCLFIFMPGVPFEMEKMFEQSVISLLQKRFDFLDSIQTEKLTVFGLGESKVGHLLRDFSNHFDNIQLGFRAVFPIIEVKITTLSKMNNDKTQVNRAKNWIAKKLGKSLFSLQGLTLEEELGRVLIQKKLTLAVAESCTGGLISSMVTDVAGSSEYFLNSVISYTNDAKINILKVKKETIIKHGAVHDQTALEMAKGVKTISLSDCSISTSGIAGPGGGTTEKPVGSVCIGITGPGFAKAKTFYFNFDDRSKNKKIFAAAAISWLLRNIKKI